MYNEEKIKAIAEKMKEMNKRYNLPTKPNKKKNKDKKVTAK